MRFPTLYLLLLTMSTLTLMNPALADEPNMGIAQLDGKAQEYLKAAQERFNELRFEAALGNLKLAHSEDPSVGLPEVNMARAWAAVPLRKECEKLDELRNTEEAEGWFRRGLAAHGKDMRVPREYGRWLLNQARIDDAEKQFIKAQQLDSNDSETKALMGLMNRYKQNYSEADKLFTEVNRKDPNNVFYAWNLAIVKAESKDEKERLQAIKIATEAKDKLPYNPESSSVLGWCLYKADRIDDAYNMMLNAFRLGNNHASSDTCYYMACILRGKGEDASACIYLVPALLSKTPFVYRKNAEELNKLIAKQNDSKKTP